MMIFSRRPMIKTRWLQNFIGQHQDKFWWFHSFYSLLLGVGVMWLGTRHFAYLRVAVFHIAFIWATSLLLPTVSSHPRLKPEWKIRIRLLINYFQRNFYQQLLFFVLPIYYLSASGRSLNMVFVIAIAVSALLATLDIVYDRHLSLKSGLMAVFFAFNLFVCINVMLPIMLSIKLSLSLRISALLALAGFATFHFRHSFSRPAQKWVFTAIAALFLLAIVEPGRSLIPPAPLRLMDVGFGLDLDRETLRIATPLSRLPTGGAERIYALTAIRAPQGLKDNIRHRWYLDGRLVYASPFHPIQGGRKTGFRLWTSVRLQGISPLSRLRLDVETEGGQLIGRKFLD
jgi:hypothetical protein